MKYFALLLVGLVLLQAANVHAQGRLFCDEICGSTDEVTNFSAIEVDLYVADQVITTEFQGTLPEGFGLETVGGIRVAAAGDTTINSETDLSISTPISGILEIFGSEADINTGGSFTITANDDVFIDAELINLSTGTNTTGDIIFDSNLSTSIEGVNGIAISSLFRDVNFLAPSGTVSIASDVLTFVSGDTVDDQRLTLDARDISINTDGTFDINSGAEISLTAEDDIVLESRSRDLTLEAFNQLNLNADHVNLEATSFVTLNSLIGDLLVNAADTAGFYGFSALFQAEGAASLTASSVDLFSTGNVAVGVLPQATVDINAVRDIGFTTSDTGSVSFTGVTGDLSVTARDLDVATDSLFIETGEAPGNSIELSATGSLSFASDNEGIRFDGSSIGVTAGSSLSFDADGTVAFLMNNEHSENPLLSSSIGNFVVAAGGDFRADVSDAVFTSDTTLQFSADSVAFSGLDANIVNSFEENFQFTTINVSADDLFVTSEYNVVHDTEAYQVTAVDDAEIFADLYDLTIVTDVFSSTQNSNVIAADLGSIVINAADLDVTGGDITISADSSADQSLTLVTDIFNMIAGGQATFSAAEINYAAGFSLLVGTAGVNTGVTFTGDDQYFESTAGDILFDNVSMDVTGTEGVAFRSDDRIVVGAAGSDLVINAPATDVASGSTLTLTGDTLTITGGETRFSAVNTLSWTANDELNLTGTGPNGSVSFTGGEITHSHEDIDFFAATVELEANNRVVLSTGLGNAIDFNAGSDLSFSAGTDSDSGAMTVTIENDTTTTVSSLSFTSEVGDSIALTAANEITIDATMAVGVSGNNMDINALNDVSFVAGGDLQHNTVVSTEMYANGNVGISGANIIVTGEVVTFDFADGDNVINVDGDSDSGACGNIDVFVNEYELTSAAAITVNQVVNPCGDDPTRQAGDFRIVTHAEGAQVMVGDGDFNVDTTESLTVRSTSVANAGGVRLFAGLVDAAEYGITFNSSTSITIDSLNTEYEFQLPRDDRLDAPQGEVLATADGWIKFEANGFENNFNTQNFGIYLQTAEHPLRDSVTTNDADTPVVSDIRFESIDGNMLVEAEDLLRVATFRPLATAPSLQRMDVVASSDILLDAGVGALFVTSGGALMARDDLDDFDLDDFDLRPDSSLHLYAHTNDISTASNGALVFNGRDGLSFESTTDNISFESVTGISTSVSSVAGDLSYFSEFGIAPIDALAGDITFSAGNNLQEAGASFSASGEFIVTSGLNQQYRSYGALVSPDQLAINLVGEDGPVAVTSAEDVSFLSSGSTRFDAGNGDITVTMAADVVLFSDARANFTSQFTSSATVLAGDLSLNALGGGGSVDIHSDTNQDLVGTAGDSISVDAHDDVLYAAKTGIAATANNGDIDVIQRGFNQDTLVHSEGTALLQADGPGGIRIAGRNVLADAVNDINVDAANFNVGAAGTTNTATEPLVVVRAGGDSDTNGLNVNSGGNIEWTTSEVSTVQFEANALDTNVGGDITISANGVISVDSVGHLEDGLFTLSAGDVLTLTGGEAAILHGEATNSLSTSGSINFENIGTDAEDAFVLHSSNNLFVSGRNGVGGSFVQTAGDIVGEFRDFGVISDDISMTNSPGNGGQFTFDSDTHIFADSIGDIAVQASNDVTIATAGEDSNVEFNSGAETTLTSSGSLAVSSTSFDLDSPEGVAIAANGGELSLTASDDISIIANATATFTSRNTITIEAGYIDDATTAFHPKLNITSRGTADFISRENFDITVGDSLTVAADKDLLLANSVPLRARDQGDVRITSLGNLDIFASGDHDVTADRNIEVVIDGDSTQSNGGDIRFIATASNADVKVESTGGDIELESEGAATFAAGTASIVADLNLDAVDDIAISQLFEENFAGGIRVASTGAAAVTAFDIAEGVELNAGVAILGTSAAGYGHIMVDGDLSIETFRIGSGAIFESSADDVVVTVASDFENSVADEEGDVLVFISGNGAGSNEEPSVLIQADGNVIFDADNDADVSRATALNVESGGRIVLDLALEEDLSIDLDAENDISIIANGMSTGATQFGIQIEADEEVDIGADFVHLHANGVGGRVNLVASESFTLDAEDIFAHAGDSLVVSTGFTPPLNAGISQREAIVFSGDDLVFGSTHRDVVINAEDVSWAADTSFTITAAGQGAGVTFSVDNAAGEVDFDGDVDVTAHSVELVAGGNLSVESDNDFRIDARDGVTITVGDELFVTADDFDLIAEEEVVLLTPEGHVNFMPNAFFNTPRFNIPPLESRAGVGDYTAYTDIQIAYPTFPNYQVNQVGISGSTSYTSLYRFSEGNGQSGCPNRAFGFDEETYDMCVCLSGQWSCARASPRDFVYLTNSGFFN